MASPEKPDPKWRRFEKIIHNMHTQLATQGDPVLQPVPDTQLMYVVNSPYPIIMAAPNQWYAVQNGIWFNWTDCVRWRSRAWP